MIAAPGGGKGTQGERLASHFSVQHVSSVVEVDGNQSPEEITAEIQARLAGR